MVREISKRTHLTVIHNWNHKTLKEEGKNYMCYIYIELCVMKALQV